MKTFLEAYEIAKDCHRKQRRRGSDDSYYKSKEDYIHHVLTSDYRTALIKMYDRLDNINSLDIETKCKKFISFRKYYIRQTENIFLKPFRMKQIDFTSNLTMSLLEICADIEKKIKYLKDKYSIVEVV